MEGFRLSPQQKHLWRVSKGRIRADISVFLPSVTDPQGLQKALLQLGDRYEILRTRFRFLGAEIAIPVQVIDDHMELDCRICDWSHCTRTEIEQKLDAFMYGPLDIFLDDGAHLSARVAVTDEGCYTRLALPALRSDCLSLVHMLHEAVALCQNGGSLPFDEEDAFQYADVAEAFYELLEGEDSRAGMDFWMAHRPATPPDHSITAPPGKMCSRALTVDFRVPDGLPEDHFLMACWLILFRRMGHDTVSWTRGYDGRTFEELAGAPGLFERHLPVYTLPQPGENIKQLVARLEGAHEETIAYQDYFQWDQVRSPEEGEPWFPFSFDYQVVDLVQPLRLDACATRAGIRVDFVRCKDRLQGRIHYDSSRYDAAFMDMLCERFRVLAGSLASKPEGDPLLVPMMGNNEIQWLTHGFNPESVAESGQTLWHLFSAAAAENPQAPALTHGDETLSFGQLLARSRLLGGYLVRQGVGPDVPVGLCCERSVDMVVGLLSITCAGGAYVPMDTAYPDVRLEQIMNDSGLSHLLTTRSHADRFAGHQATLVLLDELPAMDAMPLGIQPAPENLAYVIYTSGSTGRPKGVGVTHRGLSNYLCRARELYPGKEGGRVPLHSPIGFDLTVTGLWLPLIAGREVVLVDDGEGVEVLQGLGELLNARSSLDFVKLTPAHLNGLAQLVEPDHVPDSVGAMIIGGEALRGPVLDFWRKNGPRIRLINEYGPTEATVGCCIHEVDAGDGSSDIPIGRPIGNIRLYLCNEHLELSPLGVPGELLIGGAGLARGYLGMPAGTAVAFVPDPFGNQPGERLYRSGDLACHITRGGQTLLQYMDRLDNQVKINGFRIELGEIEAVLLEHEAVHEAAVLVREVRPNHPGVSAWLTTVEDVGIDETRLRIWLAAHLPDQMIPGVVTVLETMPLTDNGKIDRKALMVMPLNQTAEYVAPRNENERILAEIWAALLGLEQVGVHDNFFALGGDSVLCIQSVTRARQAGLVLTPKQVFDHQTIAEVAGHLEQGGAISAEQGTVTGSVPLLPIQRWFFDQNLPSAGHFNQTLLLAVDHPLDSDRMERATGLLAEHHDALRLRFTRHSEGAVSQVNDGLGGPSIFGFRDLSDLEPDAASQAVTQASELAQSNLEPHKGPLAAIRLFQMPDGSSRLLVAVHHLAMDGVSQNILLEDLGYLYTVTEGEDEPQLPRKTTSYKEWAQRLHRYAQEPVTTGTLPFWLKQICPKNNLPLQRDALAGDVYGAMKNYTLELDGENTRALLQEAGHTYNTRVDEMMLAALMSACHGLGYGDRLLVDLEGHGRESLFDDVDLSRTMGWFTTIYPVVLSAAPGHPGETLMAVKETLRRVPDNGLSYGLLRYLNPETGALLSKDPGADVLFNYMGRNDNGGDENTWLRAAPESAGPARGSDNRRSHPLEINSFINGDRLVMIWSYCEAVINRTLIETLAGGVRGHLEQLIQHCLDPNSGAITPSDFSDVELDSDELEALVDDLDF